MIDDQADRFRFLPLRIAAMNASLRSSKLCIRFSDSSGVIRLIAWKKLSFAWFAGFAYFLAMIIAPVIATSFPNRSDHRFI
jgi:hypothetical protein